MKITVLLGGDSPERKVSLASGTGIINALRQRGHDVRPLDPAVPLDKQDEPTTVVIGENPPEDIPSLSLERRFEWLQSERLLEADVTFVGLHGGAGEDGTVQALLDSAGYPYTGTGVLGSALAMNKDRSKALFREAGVQTAEHLYIAAADEKDPARITTLVEEGLGFPVVVKPNCQGSSVGFSYVPSPADIGQALAKAAGYDSGVIVERFIPGREVTVSILGNEPLPVVEIIPEGGFYDYKRKYTKGTSRYVAPAEIDGGTADRIKREAVNAYHALCCRDYARVDFRLSEEGEPYCLEVNTLPGMTGLSLVPMAARCAGIEFDELCERICRMAASGRGRCL